MKAGKWTVHIGGHTLLTGASAVARRARRKRRALISTYLAPSNAPHALSGAPVALLRVSTTATHPAIAHDSCSRFRREMDILASSLGLEMDSPPVVLHQQDDAGFWDAEAVFLLGAAIAEDVLALLTDFAENRLGLTITVTSPDA